MINCIIFDEFRKVLNIDICVCFHQLALTENNLKCCIQIVVIVTRYAQVSQKSILCSQPSLFTGYLHTVFGIYEQSVKVFGPNSSSLPLKTKSIYLNKLQVTWKES